MTEAAIELAGVRKHFGSNHVLEDLSLRVPAGSTYAFLGRNGAGKTTTIRMLMGLLKPDGGTIRVLGLDPAKDAMEIRRRVGYLAEDQGMWGWMKVREILGFVAPFYPTWDWELAKELCEKFALSGEAKIKHLSKGQNVRLGLLLALAHRPRLVVLDDPVLGLDPIMRKEFLREVVTHLQGNDVTVFFSSHLLYEVEPVADVVGILDGGRMVRQEQTEALREQVKLLTVPQELWAQRGGSVPGVLDVRPAGHRVAVVVAEVGKARAALGPVGEAGMNLDEIFEAYVAGKPQAGGGARTDVRQVA